MTSSNIVSLSDITNAYYINLDHRVDRREHMEVQIAKLQEYGLTADVQRFNAIRMKNGAIGCTMSHLRLLENAVKENMNHILIMEDDVDFLNMKLFKRQFTKCIKEINEIKEYKKNVENKWDVILFSGNIVGSYTKVYDGSALKVNGCQTTTAYLVNGHYIRILAENVRKGLTGLLQEPENALEWAIDRHWFNLQLCDEWLLIVPLCVVQKEGYSDVEEKWTDYRKVTLDVDKRCFLQNLGGY